MIYVIQCWIEHPNRRLDQTFTYYSLQAIQQGVRVIVDFNHQQLVGFTSSCTAFVGSLEELQKEMGFVVKPIQQVLDETPLITKELYDLAFEMKRTTVSTTISCFQAMLPEKIKPVSNDQKAVMEQYVKVLPYDQKLTPKQLEAYQFVKEKECIPYKELRKHFPNQAKALVDLQAIDRFEKEKPITFAPSLKQQDFLPLTKAQQAAFDEIHNGKDSIYLLKGVTGSGKTEVYLHLAKKVLEEGKQVLILVPEIGLTPQMIERVSSRFTNKLAIYHSGLNAQEKYEQYKAVKNNIADIVVGTRSSVFLPFQNLGLIVMDEEHDSSYKQDIQPCYHCRDIAMYRGQYHNCKVVLGSATPSLESYARALKGVYHLVRLEQRIATTLPRVSLVPLKEAMEHNESYIITLQLYRMMEEAFKNNKQVILMLNRRGYYSVLHCNTCNEVIKCPNCDLAMSYHAIDGMMMCHTCGTKMKVPTHCPSCHQPASFMTSGFGTERLQKEVEHYFPHARVLRMDADTTTRKNAKARMIQAFANKEYDVLLGTQMIAKGLDFPNVSLVGVINGDEGLSRVDFRSCEETFDLLMQAAGRSGRANSKGDVVFQVFDVNHYAVVDAAKQDYDAFFEKEMQFRHAGMYPPYTFFIAITVSGDDKTKVFQDTLYIKNRLLGNYDVLGVIELLRIKNKERARLLLKGQNLNEMRNDVASLLDMDPYLKDKHIKVDVNPLHMG